MDIGEQGVRIRCPRIYGDYCFIHYAEVLNKSVFPGRLVSVYR